MLSAREIITKPVEDLKRSVHLKKEENAERQRSHPQSRCVALHISAVQLSSIPGQIVLKVFGKLKALSACARISVSMLYQADQSDVSRCQCEHHHVQ